jgi:glycosidase
MTVQRLSELRLDELTAGEFFPSPVAWEDEVLYFLMLDRFSDGSEHGYRDNAGGVVDDPGTAPFRPGDEDDAVGSPDDRAAWESAGGGWVGGSLRGLESKIGYLARMNVTAIWVSPVFKQVSFKDTYHGYGVQNFLDVDPHFGTTEDLRRMVRVAHEHGIRVILDIILNHVGDVFAYDADRYAGERDGVRFVDPRWDGRPYRPQGFRDAGGAPALPFGPVDLALRPDAWPDGAIWPAEFQDPATFTQRGRIDSWDWDPEFLEGDFFDLKNVTHGQRALDAQGAELAGDYRPAPALAHLVEVFSWWIAFADVDGFRIDTVKHMDLGATRIFAAAIHEFAESIGKQRFLLVGEITGGRERAYRTLEETGIDAALGIDDIPDKLEFLVKGYRNPQEYFDLFRNSLLVNKDSHTWFKDKVVTLYDDHDQVRKGNDKARFCADALGRELALNALFLNALTLGIPCIYYGSEQRFDGAGGNDRFIREAMFGGAFGPHRSRDRHCFDEDEALYQELAKVLALRRRRMELRRGRQYLREISGDGAGFGLPRLIGGEMRSVVAWSRIFVDRETLLAINTDPAASRTAWVTIDRDLTPAGSRLTCLYSSDAGQIGEQVPAQGEGRRVVRLTVPAAGCVAFSLRPE